jgi:hypothetical protein
MFSMRRRIEPRWSITLGLPRISQGADRRFQLSRLVPLVCENPRAEWNRSLPDASVVGHKSPIMTQRYEHQYLERLRDGVGILNRLLLNWE